MYELKMAEQLFLTLATVDAAAQFIAISRRIGCHYPTCFEAVKKSYKTARLYRPFIEALGCNHKTRICQVKSAHVSLRYNKSVKARKWVEHVICNGNNCSYRADYAYGMLSSGSNLDIIQKIVENDRFSDNLPAIAYRMVSKNNINREWGEKVIENSENGDRSSFAYYMVRDCGSHKEWASNIIEKANKGLPAFAAYRMVKDFGLERRWAEEIIEKTTTLQRSEYAFLMVKHNCSRWR